jgi:hypothetical protein
MILLMMIFDDDVCVFVCVCVDACDTCIDIDEMIANIDDVCVCVCVCVRVCVCVCVRRERLLHVY